MDIISGIRRKSARVVDTKCNNCYKIFKDKWYPNEQKHTVKCPHCYHINAVVDNVDIKKIEAMGLAHDVDVGGAEGIHVDQSIFLKALKEKEENERKFGRKVA